jgi:hypothetical protein
MQRALHRQPGLRRDNKSLNARLQCRMDNWRKERAMVDREFIDSTRFLSLIVDIRVGTAHEPKY